MTSLTLDDALELSPIGYFQYRLLFICGLAFMADAMEVNLLLFLATCAGNEWNLTDQQKAILSGVVFCGIIVGSFFWGLFADRYGRKLAFLLTCIIVSLGGIISGAAPDYISLVTIRAIVGLGIGGANIPFDLLAEFLPASHRGRFLIYIEFFWTIGSILVTAIAWTTLSVHGWRTMTYLTAIPVTLTSILSVVYLPESPRWLLLKGRTAAAETVVRAAAAVNGVTLPPFSLVSGAADSALVPEANYWSLVATKEARRVSLPLWTVWAAFGFTYYGVILFAARLYTVTAPAGVAAAAAEVCSFDYASLFLNAAVSEVLGVACAALAIDRLGRIRSQELFYLLSAVMALLMGLWPSATPSLLVAIGARMFVMAASNATWVATPELYPTETRTVGHAASAACSKVGAFFAPFVVISGLSRESIGLVLASVNLVAVLAVRQLPETSGSAMGRKLSGGCLDRLGGGAGQQSGLAHRRTSDEEDSGWTEEEGRGHGVQLLLSPSRPGVGQRPQR